MQRIHRQRRRLLSSAAARAEATQPAGNAASNAPVSSTARCRSAKAAQLRKAHQSAGRLASDGSQRLLQVQQLAQGGDAVSRKVEEGVINAPSG
jgi:hypothetical protein